ncbi:MAG: DEAD/DEAH box helicase [bacterium]|nr:DEAD/DEAH box helicase [bacterium]
MCDRVHRLIQEIEKDQYLSSTLLHHKVISAVPAEYDEEFLLDNRIQTVLNQIGIHKLYSHQTEVIKNVRAGKNVVLATPTASGKSMAYFIPVLEAIINENANALFIYPLKALENDQLHKWIELTFNLSSMYDVSAAIYDGDTPDTIRKKIRATPPKVLITTPEMLHLGILPYHSLWYRFFSQLRYVVVDELHIYRGIFGTHMRCVFMRLNRITDYYGSNNTYISTSATIANPAELGEKLFGKPTIQITNSGSPQPEKHYLLFQPIVNSAFQECLKLAMISIQNGIKTIVFSRSRQETERLYIAITERFPHLKNKVSSYRAGFLPEERRDIEKRLSKGELIGVFATSALELGIDIGGLDVCILNGFPGRIATMWQRWGRIGRSDKTALAVLVASPNALDQYLMRYPDEVFSRSSESATINHKNTHILQSHLICAALELPIQTEEISFKEKSYQETIQDLVQTGELVKSKTGNLLLSHKRSFHRNVDLRSIGKSFQIFEQLSNSKIGDIDGSSVFRECHQGAVYLHNGRIYLVNELDLYRKKVVVTEQIPAPRYYTMPRTEKETEILDIYEKKKIGNDEFFLGKLRVHEQVVAYERRHTITQVLEEVVPLELPEVIFDTVGCWIVMDELLIAECSKKGFHFAGSRHACEHAMLAMLPLLALCDRNDLGGITMDHHIQTKAPTIFLYDGYNGGAGLTELGFQKVSDWINKTHRLISECNCKEEGGCPSCVQSPKCGSGNRPLDKKGAVWLLERWVGTSVSEQNVNSHFIQNHIILGSLDEEKDKNLDQLLFSTVSLEGKPIVYFDVETLRSAEEVGGWHNIREMGLALAVVFDERTQSYSTYFEKDVNDLLAHLKSAKLVVGYNSIRFDYEVLRKYDFRIVNTLNSFDLMVEIKNSSGGKRLSLSTLAKATLGDTKIADGIKSLEWVKNGQWDLIQEYCKHDVYLTKELFRFGLENGYVLYEDRRGSVAKIRVNWQLNKLVPLL